MLRCHKRQTHRGTCPRGHRQGEDFKRWRNNIGGLLLLHKSINASLNDKKYDYKIQKYCSAEGNIYTESLGQLAYINNPQFVKFVKTNNLSFEPYAQFGKDEITKRNALFAQLVTLIWNTEMFSVTQDMNY